ncbi:hypothetical protein EVA_13446 [gut metagenome]|uniref:Uncharacterized protein n=1 Tax=gut metagenome TaxID=749906 RepID=J9G9I9_9ZZZZ
MKEAGKFTAEAQKEALQRSLDTAISILSPAAAKFIQDVYGDLGEFIKPLIEAEVRKQKTEAPATIALPVMECDTDATAVAASTAAATAATYLQTAFNQLGAEAVKKEKAEE